MPGTDTTTHKNIYHYFGNVGMVSILWAYQQGASIISVVGMDGYSLYNKDNLKNKDNSQHCYGKGFTDGYIYDHGISRDIKNYRLLKKLSKYGEKKYGFSFKIITPTVFSELYDKSILDIEEECNEEDISFKDEHRINKRVNQKQKFRKNFHY